MTTATHSRENAKRETREALIRAGLMEFFEHGLDVPSLDAICARAGYTRGAFYVHFRDRDDFVVAAMDSILGEFLDAIIAADSEADDLDETVMRFAKALSEDHPLIGKQGSMRTHQMLAACNRADEIRARFVGILGEAIRRVEGAAASARQGGAVRGDLAARPLASLLVALALGLVQMLELGVSLDLASIRTVVLRMLRAAEAPSRRKRGTARKTPASAKR